MFLLKGSEKNCKKSRWIDYVERRFRSIYPPVSSILSLLDIYLTIFAYVYLFILSITWHMLAFQSVAFLLRKFVQLCTLQNPLSTDLIHLDNPQGAACDDFEYRNSYINSAVILKTAHIDERGSLFPNFHYYLIVSESSVESVERFHYLTHHSS